MMKNGAKKMQYVSAPPSAKNYEDLHQLKFISCQLPVTSMIWQDPTAWRKIDSVIKLDSDVGARTLFATSAVTVTI